MDTIDRGQQRKPGRPGKPPRLYLRKARPDIAKAALWVIVHQEREIATGYGEADRAAAQHVLDHYNKLCAEVGPYSAAQALRRLVPK